MTMLNVQATTLASRLRTARLVAGREQADMAEALGVSRNTVSSWENGRTEPSVSQFIEWAAQTKQPVDLLIDGLPGSCARRDSNSQPSDLYSDGFWTAKRALSWLEFYCQDILDAESTHSAGRS